MMNELFLMERRACCLLSDVNGLKQMCVEDYRYECEGVLSCLPHKTHFTLKQAPKTEDMTASSQKHKV